MTSRNNGINFDMLRRREAIVHGRTLSELIVTPFPDITMASWTLRIIDDVVDSLDTGKLTTGGDVRFARANMELIFGFIESHRQSGARTSLPLEDTGIRLVQHGRAAHQPLSQHRPR